MMVGKGEPGEGNDPYLFQQRKEPFGARDSAESDGFLPQKFPDGSKIFLTQTDEAFGCDSIGIAVRTGRKSHESAPIFRIQTAIEKQKIGAPERGG